MNSYNLLRSPKHQLIILMFLAFGLNFNTLFSDYAVDDVIVMTHNKYVEKGVSGIPEILTTDLFSGYKEGGPILSEKRYRPLSQITFALEYQLFGFNPIVSHLLNVLIFMLLIFFLYKVLSKLFSLNQQMHLTFVTCLIFIVHPIHTEVIGNIKSRDELITFLFLILSLLYIIKHIEIKSVTKLIISSVFFLLALLARESAVTYIAVVPLVLYFFYEKQIKKAFWFTLPLLVILIVYLSLRFIIVGSAQAITKIDILNSPFLYATPKQAFATKISIIAKYLQILILPYPLSSDYGFNQIPYLNITSIPFIISLLLILSLLGVALFYFKKKSVISFSILYFFVTILLVSNLIVDIGTPFSERLLLQPSLAFCILIAVLYINMKQKFKVPANIGLTVILLLFAIQTYSRNQDWKNNDTLYSADIISTPNSLRINLYLTESYLAKANTEKILEKRVSYFKQTIKYAKQSLKIAPKHLDANKYLIDAYSGLLCCYPFIDLFFNDVNFNSASTESKEIIENISSSFYKQGNGLFEQRKLDEAIFCYKKAIELNPKNVEVWYNLGGTYLSKKDTRNARIAWDSVKSMSPNHPLHEDDF